MFIFGVLAYYLRVCLPFIFLVITYSLWYFLGRMNFHIQSALFVILVSARLFVSAQNDAVYGPEDSAVCPVTQPYGVCHYDQKWVTYVTWVKTKGIAFANMHKKQREYEYITFARSYFQRLHYSNFITLSRLEYVPPLLHLPSKER